MNNNFELIIYIIGLAWLSNSLVWGIQHDYWLFIKSIINLFKCSKCTGFWLGLPITLFLGYSFIFSFFTALVISLVSYVIEYLLFSFKE